MNKGQELAQRVVNSQNEKQKNFNEKLAKITIDYINDMMSFEHLFEKSADMGRPLTYRVLPKAYYKDYTTGEYISGKFQIPKELKEDLAKKGYKVSIIRWGHSKKSEHLVMFMHGFIGQIIAISWGPGKQVGKFLKSNIYTCAQECNSDTVYRKKQPDKDLFEYLKIKENIKNEESKPKPIKEEFKLIKEKSLFKRLFSIFM